MEKKVKAKVKKAVQKQQAAKTLDAMSKPTKEKASIVKKPVSPPAPVVNATQPQPKKVIEVPVQRTIKKENATVAKPAATANATQPQKAATPKPTVEAPKAAASVYKTPSILDAPAQPLSIFSTSNGMDSMDNDDFQTEVNDYVRKVGESKWKLTTSMAGIAKAPGSMAEE